jgi:hypothetical protein
MMGVMTGVLELDKTRLCNVEKMNRWGKVMVDLTFKQRVKV